MSIASGFPTASGRGKLVPTDDVAVALNTAFMGDGAVIHVAEGVALVSTALTRSALGPYQLQAAIAAVHDEAARHLLSLSHFMPFC